MDTTVLVLPGIGDSGPKHWQTLWEQRHDGFVRVRQREWDRPVCAEWVETLEMAVSGVTGEVAFAAHSLGCLLVAYWAAQSALAVKGALLVAPPDPDGPTYPMEIAGFDHPPRDPLPFPSIVVASTDDPYGSIEFSQSCAQAWGSRFVDAGARGHINADSGLGDWPQGYALLRQLTG
ncbi:MAG: alpha/beta hydrolase [Acidihalobacter sp.]